MDSAMRHNTNINILLSIVGFVASADAAENAINPRVTVSSDVGQRDSKVSEPITTRQQHVQLGINILKRSRTIDQSLSGDFGFANYQNANDYSSLTRALNTSISVRNRMGTLGFSLTSKKNNSYLESIESISIADSFTENSSSSAEVNLSRVLTKKQTVSLNANYLTAESQYKNIQLRGSDTYSYGVNLNYQSSKKNTFSGNVQQSTIDNHKYKNQLKTMQYSVAGKRKASERFSISASLGWYKTELSSVGINLQEGSTANLNIKYLTGKRSSMSLSADKELQATDFGNYVDRQILRSTYSYSITGDSSISSSLIYGINTEVGISDVKRSYFQLNFGGAQQISRTVSFRESITYGKEQYESSDYATNSWRASLQLQYAPKTFL